MNEDRAKLRVGSRCRVYSQSKKKWFWGVVSRISTDDVGEWLEVRYDTTMSKQVQRYSTGIYPASLHDMTMPHAGRFMIDLPLPMSFREAFMDEQEYRLIELKGKIAVLEIEDSLTMVVPVSGLWKITTKLRELKKDLMNCNKVVMATVVSGPRWTKDRVEMVQCVVDARAADSLSVSPSALPCPDLTKLDVKELYSDSEKQIRRSWRKGDQVEIFSVTHHEWFLGTVVDIIKDDEGRWLNCVGTRSNGKAMSKQVQCYSTDVRPVHPPCNKV